MTTMPVLQWSEVQRHPGKVEKALHAHGRVRLERRGRSSILLLDSVNEAVSFHAVGAAAALLGALLAERPVFAAEALVRAFPWASVFDEKGRVQMAQEIVDAGIGGAALGELRAFDTVIRQWRNTAEAKASGVDLSSPIRTGADFGIAKRPSKRRGGASRAQKR